MTGQTARDGDDANSGIGGRGVKILEKAMFRCRSKKGRWDCVGFRTGLKCSPLCHDSARVCLLGTWSLGNWRREGGWDKEAELRMRGDGRSGGPEVVGPENELLLH